jgi:hypothetical protein
MKDKSKRIKKKDVKVGDIILYEYKPIDGRTETLNNILLVEEILRGSANNIAYFSCKIISSSDGLYIGESRNYELSRKELYLLQRENNN